MQIALDGPPGEGYSNDRGTRPCSTPYTRGVNIKSGGWKVGRYLLG
jgi:hypothetical protein